MAKKAAKTKAKSVLVDSDETLGKPIRIACKGADVVQLDALTNFQGSLKVLSEDAYLRLRMSILELGFSFPIHAWKFRNKTFILDAHQRVATLKRMRDEEGFQIPALPVDWIEAATEREAAKKLLAATSQYGELVPDGLKSFIDKFKIDIDSMMTEFQFPEINLKAFKETYFPEKTEVSFSVTKSGSKELNENDFQDFEHSCPKCGHNWNS